MSIQDVVKTSKKLSDAELFLAFDNMNEQYGRWDRRTSAIAYEIERRGYEVEYEITAADLHDYMYGI